MQASQIELIKSTIPVLEAHGVELIQHFYHRMLTHNSELRNIFNHAHQASGRQPQALAGAVLAYAQHIEDPSALWKTLERIAHKHVSLNIRAEHYAIVGKHLLAAISEVLGDQASDELIEAWAAAYQQLADVLITLESGLYQQAIDTEGGWSGWRPFIIDQKIQESDEITSFYFKPLDGGQIPTYHPGQYISIQVYVPSLGALQPRQYSLSDAPNGDYLRISVKREPAAHGQPSGQVSNLLHDEYDEGRIVTLSQPYGDFYLDQGNLQDLEPHDRTSPVTLISGGVGITPMMAMLNHLNQHTPARPVYFYHCARNRHVHAFKAITDRFIDQPEHRVHYYYDEVDQDVDKAVQPGPLTLADTLPTSALTGHFYLCGPQGFMAHHIDALKQLGVGDAQIHAETFGSGGISA
ncbi:nitric oxide dioxygenase [Terasakiispira papahanaumokuakeensis]|uniref:Flavohemoprotein n=1 Tax=Terasakiispira papahanaumokuakeensis TaxID=197479 RepID=A0A1E2VBG2_9GAMM|nr:NO-inducible flavohemoprotein [Terasakiispira papahanaumokuakeensis]ODC04339.1 nitric oxide dioxygenase [Terasakiispira papahanaumokuakeensis]